MDIQVLVEIYKDMRNTYRHALDECIDRRDQVEAHRENGDDAEAAEAKSAEDYYAGQYSGLHSSLYDLRNLLKSSGVDLKGLGIDLVD